MNATDPSELFGGTWERIKDRFVLAAGDSYASGSTGGETTHTLTVNEMPRWNTNPKLNGDDNYPIWFPASWGNDVKGQALSDTQQTSGKGFYLVDKNIGGNQPHNNMPPYLVAYMWYRVA